MRLLFLILFFPTTLFSQVAYLTIEGQTYGTGDMPVNIPRTNKTTLTFKNNDLTSNTMDDYMLVAGDEGLLSTANNLDGATITGNKFTYVGTNPADVNHVIMVGYNINDIIRYNYLDNPPYGMVLKSGASGVNMSYTTEGVAYNIFKNPRIGVRIKGMNGVCVYNNTFYNNVYSGCQFITITKNDAAPSYDTKIKNNIFYSSTGTVFIYVEDGSEAGLECDYNIYYCASGAPVFYLNGTSHTFAEWQGHGYDAHSVVVNPNFINTTAFVPTARLNYGTNLGSTYWYGLSTSAVWGTTDPAMTQQNGSWQVGARVYPASGSVAPDAAFTASATVIPIGTTVTFTDQSTATPTSWYWTFGEGTPSTSQNPTHLYNHLGTFTVSLRATNAYGNDTETKINYITVEPVSSNTYYMATDGDDGNSGSLAAPWATLDYAWSQLSAGDLLYVRGGTYNVTTTIYLEDKSGTSSDPILIYNYPNEEPVFDYGSTTYANQIYGLRFDNVDYIYVKGLRVTDIHPNGSYLMYGMILWTDVNDCTFEQMEFDNINGWGVTIGSACTDITFTNCDSHHNANVTGGDPYGDADGFQCGGAGVNNITFDGCRAWMNSDDGWDLRMADGLFTFNNCWAFQNGYSGGNGEGFKLAGKVTAPDVATVLRVVTNCASFENLSSGFSATATEADQYGFGMEVFNNISYDCPQGFYFPDPSIIATLTNNVDYGYTFAPNMTGSNTDTYNSWNGGVTVTNADFISVSSASADGERQSDGSLPQIDFLHLVAGSDLINAGTDVGLDFYGTAPDLGAFEYTAGISLPTVTTSSVGSITNTSASCGGVVTASGGSTVIARGVCWGTSTNPTTSGSHTTDGSGTGTFTSSLTGLILATTYYVRAFAINSVGTAYGNERSFTTTGGGGGGESTGKLLKYSNRLIKYGTELIKR